MKPGLAASHVAIARLIVAIVGFNLPCVSYSK
jgi:hypothetical protein